MLQESSSDDEEDEAKAANSDEKEHPLGVSHATRKEKSELLELKKGSNTDNGSSNDAPIDNLPEAELLTAIAPASPPVSSSPAKDDAGGGCCIVM